MRLNGSRSFRVTDYGKRPVSRLTWSPPLESSCRRRASRQFERPTFQRTYADTAEKNGGKRRDATHRYVVPEIGRPKGFGHPLHPGNPYGPSCRQGLNLFNRQIVHLPKFLLAEWRPVLGDVVEPNHVCRNSGARREN